MTLREKIKKILNEHMIASRLDSLLTAKEIDKIALHAILQAVREEMPEDEGTRYLVCSKCGDQCGIINQEDWRQYK